MIRKNTISRDLSNNIMHHKKKQLFTMKTMKKVKVFIEAMIIPYKIQL